MGPARFLTLVGIGLGHGAVGIAVAIAIAMSNGHTSPPSEKKFRHKKSRVSKMEFLNFLPESETQIS